MSYADAHKSPNGAGDARPTAVQIIKDEKRTDAFKGRNIFITGCSSGLGVETANALALTGADLYLTARNLDKAKDALGKLASSSQVHLLEMDLNSLDSVRACAKAYLQKADKLSILICNAGVMHTPEGKTADGFETQFGINHLAHFLLFNELRGALLAGASPDFASRVIFVSSSGHRITGVNFDDYNFEKHDYNGWAAYGQSKTGVIYTANEINRRYGSQGLHAMSLHPGSILSGLQKTVPDSMREQWKKDEVKKVMKSTEQGAATSVWGATAHELEGKGGIYLEDCGVAQEAPEGAATRSAGYAKHAFDEEKEEKLWKLSSKLVGIKDE